MKKTLIILVLLILFFTMNSYAEPYNFIENLPVKFKVFAIILGLVLMLCAGVSMLITLITFLIPIFIIYEEFILKKSLPDFFFKYPPLNFFSKKNKSKDEDEKEEFYVLDFKKFLMGRLTITEIIRHIFIIIPVLMFLVLFVVGVNYWFDLFTGNFHPFRIIDINPNLGLFFSIIVKFIIFPYFVLGIVVSAWTFFIKLLNKKNVELSLNNDTRNQYRKDIENRLAKLKKLLDDNAISKEEYEEQRKKIIGDV